MSDVVSRSSWDDDETSSGSSRSSRSSRSSKAASSEAEEHEDSDDDWKGMTSEEVSTRGRSASPQPKASMPAARASAIPGDSGSQPLEPPRRRSTTSRRKSR